MSSAVPALRPSLNPHLRTGRVAVLGCGSVGGLAAWHLAAAGVGQLALADRDRLTRDNLRRHLCGRDDLGRPKAEAVAGFLNQRYPALVALPRFVCLRQEPEVARNLLHQADVALVAVDDEGLKHLLSDIAYQTRTPLVLAGVHGNGWAIEVMLVDPSRPTPCYACTARSLGRVGVPVVGAPSPAYRGGLSGAPDTGWAVADLGSIGPAAVLAAEVAAARLLATRQAADPRRSLLRRGDSAWRLALQPMPEWNLAPWRIQAVPVRIWPDCPTCECPRQDNGSLDDLLVPDARP